MNEALTYDDVLLVPKYSDINSRKEIDIGNDLDDLTHLSLPIVASPMDTVCGSEMAAAMAAQGGLGIIHRYNNVTQQAKMVKKATMFARSNAPIGAAIGVSGDYMERASTLIEVGAEVLCVDVAHGHHSMMREALKQLNLEFSNNAHIMAGNVATTEAYQDLCDWGAHSVRVGIGGGSICSTRIQTGHGVPSIEALRRCAELDLAIPIIADGGIKNSGDIVKALAAGADFVMVGSLLAGTTQAPGDIISVDGMEHKSYRGMASAAAQTDWKGKCSFAEGVATTIPYKGNAIAVLTELRAGILSGFSYSGAKNINELWAKAEFIRQTPAGRVESSTHILNK